MTVVNRATALASANVIRTEVVAGDNTADRVGQHMVDMVDSVQFAGESAAVIKVKALRDTNLATLSGLAQSADSILYDTDGELAFLTAQSTGAENGPWEVKSGAWERPASYQPGASAGGTIVQVLEGTVYEDQTWVCTTDPPSDVVDTDVTAWEQTQLAGDVVGALRSNTVASMQGVEWEAGSLASVNINDNEIARHSTSGGSKWVATAFALSAMLAVNPGVTSITGGTSVGFSGGDNIEALGDGGEWTVTTPTAQTGNAKGYRFQAPNAPIGAFVGGSVVHRGGASGDGSGTAGGVGLFTGALNGGTQGGVEFGQDTTVLTRWVAVTVNEGGPGFSAFGASGGGGTQLHFEAADGVSGTDDGGDSTWYTGSAFASGGGDGGSMGVVLGLGDGPGQSGDAEFIIQEGGLTGNGGSWAFTAGASSGATATYGDGAQFDLEGGQHGATVVSGGANLFTGDVFGTGNGTVADMRIGVGSIANAAGTKTAGNIFVDLDNTNAGTPGGLLFRESTTPFLSFGKLTAPDVFVDIGNAAGDLTFGYTAQHASAGGSSINFVAQNAFTGGGGDGGDFVVRIGNADGAGVSGRFIWNQGGVTDLAFLQAFTATDVGFLFTDTSGIGVTSATIGINGTAGTSPITLSVHGQDNVDVDNDGGVTVVRGGNGGLTSGFGGILALSASAGATDQVGEVRIVNEDSVWAMRYNRDTTATFSGVPIGENAFVINPLAVTGAADIFFFGPDDHPTSNTAGKSVMYGAGAGNGTGAGGVAFLFGANGGTTTTGGAGGAAANVGGNAGGSGDNDGGDVRNVLGLEANGGIAGRVRYEFGGLSSPTEFMSLAGDATGPTWDIASGDSYAWKINATEEMALSAASFTLRVPLFRFGATVVAPLITQAAVADAVGQDLTVEAQGNNSAGNAAGNLILGGGINAGAGDDGDVDVETSGIRRVTFSDSFVDVVVTSLVFNSGVTAPVFAQSSDGSGDLGELFTGHAQNVTTVAGGVKVGGGLLWYGGDVTGTGTSNTGGKHTDRGGNASGGTTNRGGDIASLVGVGTENDGNLAMLYDNTSWNSMEGGMFWGEARAVPTGNPGAGDVYAYIEASVVKIRDDVGCIVSI